MDKTKPHMAVGKRKRKRRISKRTALIIAGVVLLILILFNIKSLSPTNISSWLSGTGSSTGGFPYALSNSSCEKLCASGDRLVLLTDNSLIMLNKSGTESFKLQHKLDSPKLELAGNEYLLYSRGGTAYKLIRSSYLSFSGKTEENIITGAVSRNGSFALATKSSDGNSELHFYSDSFKELKSMVLSEEYITHVRLSDDGRLAVISTISLVDTVKLASIRLIDIDKGEITSTVKFNDAFILDFSLTKSGAVNVLTDSGICFINKKFEKENEYPFDGTQASRYDIADDGSIAVVLDAKSADIGERLIYVDKNGESVFTVSLVDEVKSVFAGKSISVLLSDRVISFSTAGKQIADTLVTRSAQSVTGFAGKTYIQTINEIDRI